VPHQGRVRLPARPGFQAYGVGVEPRDILDELRNILRVRRIIAEQGRGAIDEI
jgi:hypothetical protein